MSKKNKLIAMRKLAQTKSFILLTDTQSLIHVEALSPDQFEDVQLVAAHQANLEIFRERIGELIKKYEKVINRQMGVTENKKKPIKGKRIPVKQG